MKKNETSAPASQPTLATALRDDAPISVPVAKAIPLDRILPRASTPVPSEPAIKFTHPSSWSFVTSAGTHSIVSLSEVNQAGPQQHATDSTSVLFFNLDVEDALSQALDDGWSIFAAYRPYGRYEVQHAPVVAGGNPT
jgi:hypothetical protein